MKGQVAMSRTTVGVGEASRIFPGLCLVNSGQWRSGELVLQLRSVVREVSRRQMIVNLIERHHADYSGRLTVSTPGLLREGRGDVRKERIRLASASMLRSV